ncbi:terminase TerL endonuclease subunit, partial [Escherichia coli]
KTASALAAGYSAKTARVKGSQLAKDPEVLAFIARKQCETVEVDEAFREVSRFQDFVACGDMTIVRRVGDDTAEVAEYVRRIHEAELLDHIGIDPSGVGQILDSLAEAGIPDESVVGISQGWKLGGAIKTTERKLAEGVLVHGGQPLMAWCVGNARVEPKGNAILITKQASGRGKIDPLMALFNAVSLMSLNPEPKKKEYAVFFI